MVKTRMFKGYRPSAEVAATLPSPPYDVLNSEEARAMAGANEHSFLHVNKAEISLPEGTDLYSDAVYAQGVANLNKFVEKGWLVRDEKPAYYVYAQEMNGKVQYGLVCEVSIDDYAENRIKKHENTRKKKEDDRTRLTYEQNANVGPVFLAYQAVADVVEAVEANTRKGAPAHEFTATDGVKHTLWVVDDAADAQKVKDAMDSIPALYVADGHHRAASAYRVGQMRREEFTKAGNAVTGDEDFNFFLAVLFPHNELTILDYNRIVTDIGAHTEDTLVAALGKAFDVSAPVVSGAPSRKNEIGMYMGGKWRMLSVRAECAEADDVVRGLDVSILTNNVLEPLFGIANLRQDTRIGFVGGARGLGELERLVDGGKAAVAFSMFPMSVQELIDISDAGKLCPPKATWFEPKLASGVVVRIMDKK